MEVDSETHNEVVDITFHDIDYSMFVSTHGSEVLIVEIEDKDTLTRWRGEFSAKYVEDITSKTGSFKKFPVFVRMLLSAVRQQSDSVFIDLLTYQDLEMLKSKKASGTGPTRQLPVSTKRYLILTYASEFDRVHYPLPLTQEDSPDPERLKAVIQQLRQELQQQQHVQQQQNGYGHEDDRRLSNDHASSSSELGRLLKQTRAERDQLQSRVESLELQIEQEKAAHRRELRRKAKELQQALEEAANCRDALRDQRSKCKQLTEELEVAQRRQAEAAGSRRQQQQQQHGSYRWSGSSAYLSGSSKYPPRSSSRDSARAYRDNSRGSSPATSRGTSPSNAKPPPARRGPSPGHLRPWAQGSTPPRPPRPSSCPPRPRFDPTEYVRQKKERERQSLSGRIQGSSRQSTPTRSRPSSDLGTPIACRSPFLQGGLRDSSSSSRPGSRPSSRPGSITRERPSVYAASPVAGRGRVDQQSAPGRTSSVSPGRALQDVRNKLTTFVQKQQQKPFTSSTGSLPGRAAKLVAPSRQPAAPHVSHQPAALPTDHPGSREAVGPVSIPAAAAAESAPELSAAAPIASRPSVFDDASSEIADIDKRLQSLQNFLKKAKTSMAS